MLEKFLKRAEELGWKVSYEGDCDEITFQRYSLEGQDFSFEISYEDGEDKEDIDILLNKIEGYCDNFDVSEETYLWLDDFGHGKNGAPYDMKDVYEDMQWCLDAVDELQNNLTNLKLDLEQNEDSNNKKNNKGDN